MRVIKLLSGKITGLVKLKNDRFDKKISLYGLEFEFLKINSAIIETVEEVNLHDFKLKPFAELNNQKVELIYENISYYIELEQAVINNLEIQENITTTNNERFLKFSGDIFSELSYLIFEEKPIIDSEEKLVNPKKIVPSQDTTIKKSIKDEIKIKNAGCFSSTKSTDSNESRTLFNKKTYTDFKTVYKLNTDYLKSKSEAQKEIAKKYWARQSSNRRDFAKADHSPFKSLSSSFLSIIALLLCLFAMGLLGIELFKEPINLAFVWDCLGLISIIIIVLYGWFVSPYNSTYQARILRVVATGISLVILFTSNLFDFEERNYDYDRDRDEGTEVIEETVIEDQDNQSDNQDSDEKIKTEQVIKKSLKWNDFKKNTFHEDFKTSVNDYKDGREFLNNLNIQYTGSDFWSKLYLQAYKHESKKNKYILRMYNDLKPINENNSLSRREKLEAIITSVQEIPYYLIHEGSCSEDASRSAFSRDYHSQNQPCESSKRFGLALPSEFSANFKGDCDTRSLYLFMVLKLLGYDPAILVSEAYGHAILGINMPGPGKYVRHRGKKYLTLETTSKGWEIGQLPPNVGDTRKWHVALN